MIATFFRWRMKPGGEDEFRAAWNRATRYFLERGSHGSSLWRAEDGDYCAFALWPDAATRTAAFVGFDRHPDMMAMSAAVSATLLRIDLEPLDHHWRLPSSTEAR